jgi:hypothetical protein
MAAGQDWCIQCGAGAPGSLGSAGWRSAGAILAAAAVLALGAAAAAYAALSKSAPTARVVTTTVAQVQTPPATPPPVSPLSTPPPKAAPPVITTPPKIPLTTSTPKAASETTTPTTTTPSTTETGGASGEETQPTAIVLDTNAASTYNPYKLPGAFGDPSLAIDGDPTTGWTAQVEPATAPKMAEGVLFDLKSPQKLSAVALITTTPGLTVQVYGANGTAVPGSITDHAWVPLSHSTVVTKRHLRLTLLQPKRAFRFVTLWISRAPASSVGTPQAPGRISVNELELFPAA